MKTKSKTYTIKEFAKLYSEDYFELDLKGHEDARNLISSKILNVIDFALKCIDKHKDNDELLSFYEKGPIIGQPFSFGFEMTYFKCEHCGKNVYLGLIDEKIISTFTITEEGKFELDHTDDKCEFEEGIPYQKAILNLEEELVFVNAFRNSEGNGWLFSDAPEGMEYDQEYELSTFKGRRGITKHKESLNVAYGTMSNMIIGIYANKERDHFIISDVYFGDCEESNPERIKRCDKTLEYLKEYEMLGSISLGVWRWEATDRKTLDKHGYDESKHKPEYEELLSVKVPSGRWELTHKFDSYDFGFNFSGPAFTSDMEIYSELKLIK